MLPTALYSPVHVGVDLDRLASENGGLLINSHADISSRARVIHFGLSLHLHLNIHTLCWQAVKALASLRVEEKK